MSKQFLFIILIAVCSISAFSQSDDKANVLAVERSMAATFGKHDVVTLSSAFADDASVITANGNIISKQDFIKTAQTSNGATLSDMQVKIRGIVAVVIGVEVITGNDNGPYTNKLRFTDVLERTNNQWQIIAKQQTAIEQ